MKMIEFFIRRKLSLTAPVIQSQSAVRRTDSSEAVEKEAVGQIALFYLANCPVLGTLALEWQLNSRDSWRSAVKCAFTRAP